MSVLFGRIHNGVVIFDDKITLPEGTPVRVEPVETATSALQQQLLDWAGKGIELPQDLARQHDHYLHRHED